jgi:hypothetical protein
MISPLTFKIEKIYFYIPPRLLRPISGRFCHFLTLVIDKNYKKTIENRIYDRTGTNLTRTVRGG